MRPSLHGRSNNSALFSRAILDPDWRTHKSEGVADLIFEESLIGEVELHAAVGEKYERGWRYRRLCHVQDFHPLAHGYRGALEID